ncbi:MAG: 3-oxoacyl-[acyl-carrier-protein] synthase III C-terminal domain-containing protein [Desulfobacter sp.]
MNQIGIVAMDYFLPEKERLVSDIFKEEKIPLDAFSKKINFLKDTGIETVRVSDELPSELSLKAAKKVLAKANIAPEEIDLLVGFTSIPEDYTGPTWSAIGYVQEKLGMKNAFATAVNTGGCASFHVALEAACALMNSSDDIKTALLVAGDRTPTGNKIYFPITVTSDGGGALILKKDHNRGQILGIENYSIGRLHDVWYVPGIPLDRKGPVDETAIYMHCDYDKFNKTIIPLNAFMFRKIIRSVLKKNGLSLDDIDYFIYPSFTKWDQSTFMKAMNIPPEKIYLDNLKRIGHVQESDMVINYVDAVSDGHITEGKTVMVVSNGAGFFWSAAIVKQ